jgi:Leucine-rich repeat (LRR) protein
VRKVRFFGVGDRLTRLVQSPLLSHIRELDLSGNDLGNRGPILLSKSKHLVHLDALDLSFNEFSDKGLEALANSPVFGKLKSLQISGTGNLRFGVPGLRALADSQHLTELLRLDVSGNSLPDVAIRTLLDGSASRNLRQLLLHSNRLGDSGTAAFVESLVFAKMAEQDRVIDLSGVDMGPTGARALAAARYLPTVEALYLEGNSLGDHGLAALAASEHLTSLRILLLRDNRISDDGIRALIRSELMKTLRVLDLTGNVLREDSLDKLREASVAHNWRGPLQLIVDSHIRMRLRPFVPFGGFLRRPLP